MKKRILAAFLLSITVIMATASCGKRVECDFCGETKSGETRTVFGQDISMCNDCKESLSEF